MKTILMLTPYFPSYDGDPAGAEVLYLAKELSKDYKIFIITPIPPSEQKINVKGIAIIRPNKYLVSSHILSTFFIPLFLIFYSILIAIKNHPHIIHIHWIYPFYGYIGVIIKKIFHTKLIFTGRGTDLWNVQNFPKNKISKIKWIINNADFITTVSRKLEEIVWSLGYSKDSTRTIYCSTNILNQTPSPNINKDSLGISNKFVILFIGGLLDVKGVEYLIKGFNLFINKISDAVLVIVGKGEKENELKNLVEKFNIKNKVLFIGEVEHSKISSYFLLADVFVVPSLWEGLSIATIEAMMMRVPIIASNTGGLPELVKDGETGILVEPKDSNSIASAIEKLYYDKDYAKKLALNGYNFANERFTYKKETEAIIEVYSKVMQS